MTTLIFIAIAVAGTLGLLARPAVAIPAGVTAATAWLIAAALCWQDAATLPGALVAAALFAAMGLTCAGYAMADALGVARRERARLREAAARDEADWFGGAL